MPVNVCAVDGDADTESAFPMANLVSNALLVATSDAPT